MVRTLITPQQQNISIALSQNYVGRKVEVIAFPIDEEDAVETTEYNKSLEAQFLQLSAQWKEQTGLYSTTAQKVYNNVYLDIIGLGQAIIPFMLTDMANGGTAHWHTALKALSHENPIPDNDLSSSKNVKQAWLQWRKYKNLI